MYSILSIDESALDAKTVIPFYLVIEVFLLRLTWFYDIEQQMISGLDGFLDIDILMYFWINNSI